MRVNESAALCTNDSIDPEAQDGTNVHIDNLGAMQMVQNEFSQALWMEIVTCCGTNAFTQLLVSRFPFFELPSS